MKTWATLAAAAALTIGSAAHAGEPLKLDEAALDSVTAGKFFQVGAGTFSTGSNNTDTSTLFGSFHESSYAHGERTVSPSGESIKMVAKVNGRTFVSSSATNVVAGATGGGYVFLNVFDANNNNPS